MCLFVRDLGMAEGRHIQQVLRRSKNRIKVRRAQVVLASDQGFKVPAIAEMLRAREWDPTLAYDDDFGYSVALSSSGDTAIVGAFHDDTAGGIDAGSASVFTRDEAGIWTLQEQLLATDASAGDYFGRAVALSSA